MKIYISASNQTDNAYSAGGTVEATQCHRIAEYAATALRRNGHEVRVGAASGTMASKSAESNSWGADLYICVHTNAGGGDGTLMLCAPGRQTNPFVVGVYNAVAALSPGSDNGIQTRTNLYEINTPRAVTVYLEAEFHDNANLAQWIIDHAQDLGEAIASGVQTGGGWSYTGPAPVQTVPIALAPAPPSVPVATSALLKTGSSGAAVKALQTGLNRVFPAYSTLAADGIYGPKTTAVVKEFQRRSALVADGIVGPQTRARLAQYGIEV
jgi:hypothetical protein